MKLNILKDPETGLKMLIEDLTKQQKIKNDKIENLADSLAFVTNISNTFLNENKVMKAQIIEQQASLVVERTKRVELENRIKTLKNK